MTVGCDVAVAKEQTGAMRQRRRSRCGSHRTQAPTFDMHSLVSALEVSTAFNFILGQYTFLSISLAALILSSSLRRPQIRNETRQAVKRIVLSETALPVNQLSPIDFGFMFLPNHRADIISSLPLTTRPCYWGSADLFSARYAAARNMWQRCPPPTMRTCCHESAPLCTQVV